MGKSPFEVYLETGKSCDYLDENGNCTHGILGDKRRLFCIVTRRADGQPRENEIQIGNSFYNLYNAARCPVAQVDGESIGDKYRQHLDVEYLRKRIQKGKIEVEKDEEKLKKLTT